MANTSSVIYVTYIEKEGAYIKIWGQTNRNVPIGIEKALQQITPQFESGECLPNYENLQIGTLCCAKFKDGSYYRARVTNTNFMSQGMIEVIFIDYGNKEFVPYSTTRTMTTLPPSLTLIPPQAGSYLLANITHPPPSWNEQNFELISSEVRYLEFHMMVLTQIGPYVLIKLLRNNEDLALNLVGRGLAATITTQNQAIGIQNYLSAMQMGSQKQNLSNSTMQQLQTNTPTLLTYKAMPLEPGSEHAIFVSYVTDGPCLFSVQLKRMEDTLKKLMTEINSISLLPLEENPLPGTVCLARSVEDGYICRAVVTNMVDEQFKVFYVDFGNTEILPFEEIYQIPFKYVIPKVMATRFALAGLESSAVTLDMKCEFKNFVNDKLLYLQVKPSTTRSALAQCDLWDENKVNVLDIVKIAALASYPEPVLLSRGVPQEVIVSYVYSCNRFYVQLKSKQEELNKLMVSLQVACPTLDTFSEDKIKNGAPCYALYSNDNQWYRGQIINSSENGLTIRYVDYGNEEQIECLSNLKLPDSKKIIMLRPQAVECCLNGYQNMEPDSNRDNILQELLLENEFNMKVIETQTGRAIVELYDSAGCNVAYLLIEKLRNVQQNNRNFPNSSGGGDEKHSTSNTPNKERRPLRDQNSKWNGKPEMENWRNKSPKNYNNDNSFNKSKRSDLNRSFSPEENTSSHRNRGFDNRNEHKNRDNFRNKQNHSRNSDNEHKRFGRNDFKKDGSEKSWSDTSEKSKSWSPRNEKSQFNFKSKPKNNDFNKRKQSDDNRQEQNYDYAQANATYPLIELTGCVEEISVTWFHNPLSFYCQLQKHKDEFCTMMEDIQNAYCGRKQSKPTIGQPVIALFPEDNVLYRAIVLENNEPSYRVQYVDFGNVTNVNKIWPIETKFMQLPAQAISCGLSGVKNGTEGWPDVDKFTPYFDRDTFVCNFLTKDLNKYLVELTYGDTNVNHQLIQAQLVLPLQENLINLPQLFGQQIRVIVQSVIDLNEFTVYFESFDFTANCTLQNLNSAMEKYEDVLKKLENHEVIIYVDDVVENKLEVTLYNKKGEKYVIIEPDEGSYDNVDPLCALPVCYTTLTGYVSYVNENKLCLQPAYCLNTISLLLDAMFQYYNNLNIAEEVEAEEGQIYAVMSSDTNWYRGRAVKIDDEEVHIVYVDYGNGEVVKSNQLKPLTEEFLSQHMLAIQVIIKDSPEDYLDQEILLSLWYGDDGWEGEIKSAPQITTETTPEVFINETHQLEEATQQEQEIVVQQKIVSQQEEEIVLQQKEQIEPQQQSNNKGLSVVMSHVDSPSDFYLQFLEDQSVIANLQMILQEQIDSLQILENPTSGVLCAALYSVDQQWYRAQILDYDNDIITVRFVDYGNTDVLTNNNTMIKTLPIELITLTQYARRCSLNLKSNETEWNTTAFERFQELIEGKDLSAEVIQQNEKIIYVSLYCDNGETDVANVLLNEGHAVKLDLETEVSCTGFVSHLNSPSEFYVQLESAVGDLEWTAEQLASAESFAEIQDLTPGALCAAIFPEDEMWYRARILSNTVAGLEVLFIDYGNSCTCSSLKELPEDLVMLPPLAQKCGLQKPDGILQWSPQSVEKFREISAEGVTVFTINKIKPGETTVVQLVLNGEDISNQLLPLLEKGRVLEAAAFDKITLIKNNENEPLTCKLDQLPGYQFNEDSFNKFKEIITEVDGIFDVEFTTTNTIRLYLDSRDIRGDLDGIKLSPINSAQSTPKKNFNDLLFKVEETPVEENLDLELNDSQEYNVDLMNNVDEIKSEDVATLKSNEDDLVSNLENLEMKASDLEIEPTNLETKTTNLEIEATDLEIEATDLEIEATDLEINPNLKIENSNSPIKEINQEIPINSNEEISKLSDSEMNKTDSKINETDLKLNEIELKTNEIDSKMNATDSKINETDLKITKNDSKLHELLDENCERKDDVEKDETASAVNKL